MAGEIPSGEGSVFHFLDIFALGFGLEACAALFKGQWWQAAGGVFGAVAFHVAGTKWPQIKSKLSPRYASIVERIESNQLYRQIAYFLIISAMLMYVGFRVYRHYRQPGVVSPTKPKPLPPSPSPVAQEPPPPKPAPKRGGHHPAPVSGTGLNRYERMPSQNLATEALALAAKIRRLEDECRMESKNNAIDMGKLSSASPEDRSRLWAEQTKQSAAHSDLCGQTYNIKYKTDASMIREAMLDRLPVALHDHNADASYEDIAGYAQLRVVVSDLEKLGRTLASGDPMRP